MTAGLRDFYVFVYIDPRNYEEFYYGKGKGARRVAHLSDATDSEKVARINAIKQEGWDPIVRTIAAGLTEHEALLVETTLIWKLGKNLTTIASGRLVSLFRSHNALHKASPASISRTASSSSTSAKVPHATGTTACAWGFSLLAETQSGALSSALLRKVTSLLRT